MAKESKHHLKKNRFVAYFALPNYLDLNPHQCNVFGEIISFLHLANRHLKASDVFKVLETDFSFGNDTSNSNSSIDNDNGSTLENPYDMFPSEDNHLLYTDDLMKQCDKIITEYPALDINDFTKSNYITEFIDQLSPAEAANIHQTSSSQKPPPPPSVPPPPPPPPQNVIPHKSMATEKRKRPRSKKDFIEVQKSKHPLLSAACTPKCSLTCTNREEK